MNEIAQKGFTLVELIITLMLASILLGLGVPAFVDLAGTCAARARSSGFGDHAVRVARAAFRLRPGDGRLHGPSRDHRPGA